MSNIRKQFYYTGGLIMFISLIPGLISLVGCGNNKHEHISNSPTYEQVTDWPNLPKGYTLGSVTGVDIDTEQNVVLIHRAWRRWKILNEVFPDTPISANTILIVDGKNGNLLNNWGANLFIMPHGLAVDKENNVWVTDVGLQQVLKFTHDGKLLMKLGESRIPGNDSSHFNYPTDVAVAPDGTFYVSDGYRNSRIVKFSKEGKYLFQWGKKGSGEGEFNTPHAIDLDSNGNVYVADRENNRIQVFDRDGIFIRILNNNEKVAQIPSLTVDDGQHLFAVDYDFKDSIVNGSTVFSYDSSGTVFLKFSESGTNKRSIAWFHDITVDKDGSVYVGDIRNMRLLKFKMK